MPRRRLHRERAGPMVSVSTPACARTHRRTAVLLPSLHVAVSTLAAAPAVAQRRGVLGIVRSTPRVLVLCEYPARPLPVLRAYHASRRYFDRNELDGTIPAALSELNLLQILCVCPVRMPRSAARASGAAWHARSPRRARADVTAGRLVRRSHTPRRGYHRQRAAFK
jgi:hypothetical protein